MALTTRDRQQLYVPLAPFIGEQEAGTLLDQFPSHADTEVATIADLNLLRAEMNTGFERLEKIIHQQIRRQTIVMITIMVALLQLAARTNLFG